ncbi:hypothetical protein HFO56_24710 [Rhizobium laguerreae]|uniref:hypothetical protein n=1 Tax=Rhizobium laguerreae TaxID=1076926 RepID=UPI001C918FA2|nr:hypothetical protein [Rhizobium laguerreae]MBY3155532.1 hypothetical protein [Rhizobium laguerreae]MBY3433802.1 hypothetical protein [Rhizobium laguerreae]
MDSKTSDSARSIELIPILSAFTFVVGILFGSSLLMLCAAALLAFRFSLHVVGFARPIPQHFRKQRPPVRYPR